MFPFRLPLFVALLSTSAFAARWITPATVKMVRVQSDGTTFFRINESSQSAYYYRFDSKTNEGKSMLSNLLAAKTSGQQIQFYETTLVSGTTNQYYFDNLTIGID